MPLSEPLGVGEGRGGACLVCGKLLGLSERVVGVWFAQNGAQCEAPAQRGSGGQHRLAAWILEEVQAREHS